MNLLGCNTYRPFGLLGVTIKFRVFCFLFERDEAVLFLTEQNRAGGGVRKHSGTNEVHCPSERETVTTTNNAESEYFRFLFYQRMPGPLRKSFMRNWWAVEVRKPFPLEGKKKFWGRSAELVIHIVRPFLCERRHRMLSPLIETSHCPAATSL